VGVAGGDLKENGRGCVADAKGGPQGQQSEVRGPQTAPSRIVDEAELLLQNLDGWKGIEPFSSHSMIPPLRCSGDDTNSKSRAHDPCAVSACEWLHCGQLEVVFVRSEESLVVVCGMEKFCA
jgi:hypothetical protein